MTTKKRPSVDPATSIRRRNNARAGSSSRRPRAPSSWSINGGSAAAGSSTANRPPDRPGRSSTSPSFRPAGTRAREDGRPWPPRSPWRRTQTGQDPGEVVVPAKVAQHQSSTCGPSWPSDCSAGRSPAKGTNINSRPVAQHNAAKSQIWPTSEKCSKAISDQVAHGDGLERVAVQFQRF